MAQKGYYNFLTFAQLVLPKLTHSTCPRPLYKLQPLRAFSQLSSVRKDNLVMETVHFCVDHLRNQSATSRQGLTVYTV